LVTFSFGDCDDDDVKAAEYLAGHRMKATFYVATSRIGKEVSAEAIRYLESIGMEIGSHTVTHADVRRSSAHAWAMELYDSRCRLEDLLGMMTSFQ
jgi:peptidoglycan/xylan/chitin deacetylase (PgdA/CDA1 family)